MASRKGSRKGKLEEMLYAGHRAPLQPQGLQLAPNRTRFRAAPMCPHPIPTKQAVLVLGETCQRHEDDAILGPAGFGGDGKHLGC